MKKKYKIINALILPETITGPDGKLINQGCRINQGEEHLLQYLSNIAIKKLIAGGHIAEVRPDGSFDEGPDPAAADYLNLDVLAGLVSPGGIGRALKLIEEHKIGIEGLKAMREKCETILAQGVDVPVLKMFRDKLTQELYDIVILK